MDQDKVTLYGVGDLGFRRDDPDSLFTLVLPAFKQADILIGQYEGVFAEKGIPQAHAGYSSPVAPWKVAALANAGFHVISAASNHSLDFGAEAFLESVNHLRKSGITVTGVGRNIDEARQPAILERKGTRVAFLDYCSVLPKGYEARADRPGAAPLRATTAYEQYDPQPGMPPKVLSFANQEDLQAMVDDIKKVRPVADVVVVSMHWGIHIIPAVIAMYQREAAHAAIDAGADLILGHHTHILKGIEVYRGKVVFYSLGNFAKDGRPVETIQRDPTWQILQWELDPGYRSYPYPRDSRKTMIASCVISGKKIKKVSYLPAMINNQSQPQVAPRSDSRSGEVFDYVAWLCRDQRLDTRFYRKADEVVIDTGG